jgi:hypothetical protein
MSNPFQFFHLFILSVGDHMFTLAAGCVLTVVIGIIEKYALKRPVSWKVDIVVLLLFVFFACFEAWRDQYRLAQKATTTQPPVQIAQTINVPPATVIIEQAGTPPAQDPSGYVQVEKMEPAPDENTVAANQPLSFRIFLWNPGPHPVQDVHNVHGLGVVNLSNPDAEQSSRRAFDTFRKREVVKMVREKKPGTEIPVGLGQLRDFTVARIPALTKEQSDGIMGGTYGIYMYLWATWQDSHKRKGTLDVCYRLAKKPTTVALANESQIWATCDQPK